MSKSKKKPAANIVWFEIPADNVARARKFYSSLFSWKINQIPGMSDYWHIDTGGSDDTPDGGMMARKHPKQPIRSARIVRPSASRSRTIKFAGPSSIANR